MLALPIEVFSSAHEKGQNREQTESVRDEVANLSLSTGQLASVCASNLQNFRNTRTRQPSATRAWSRAPREIGRGKIETELILSTCSLNEECFMHLDTLQIHFASLFLFIAT